MGIHRFLLTGLASTVIALPAWAGDAGLDASVDRARVAPTIISEPAAATLEAADHLQLIDFSVQRAETRVDQATGIRTFKLDHEGQTHGFTLRPHSIRSDDFHVLVSDGSGGLTRIEAPKSRTFRGTTDQGGVVAATRFDSGWSLAVLEEDGSQWYAEPARQFNELAPAGDLLVYDARDVVAFPAKCGMDDAPMHIAAQNVARQQNFAGPGSETQGSGMEEFRVAELGIDADFEFFRDNGSSISSTINTSESIVNAVDTIYTRDVNVRMELKPVVVRTTSADPYPSFGSSGTFLNIHRNEWLTNGDLPDHDIAQLFSGGTFTNGGVIGQAAGIGTVCTSNRYAVNEISFTGSFFFRTGLVAHEMGHVFNGRHCDNDIPSSPCNIMCSGINGCNGLGLPNFGDGSQGGAPGGNIGRITSAVENQFTCLAIDVEEAEPLPFGDSFDSSTLSPDVWAEIDGADVTDDVEGAPSEPFVLRLNGFDSIETVNLDGEAVPSDVIRVTFSVRTRNTEDSDSLDVRFVNGVGDLVSIGELTGATTSSDEFQFRELAIGDDGLFFGLRVRLDASGSGDDEWLIDDFNVEPFDGTARIPFVADFENGINTQLRWDVSQSVLIFPSDGAPGQDRAARFTGSATLESFPGDLSALADSAGIEAIAEASGANAGDLLVEVQNASGSFVEVLRIAPGDAAAFETFAAELPSDVRTASSRVRVRLDGASGGSWLLEQLTVGAEADAGGPCVPSDLAMPFGILDGADVNTFISAFGGGDQAADLNGDDLIDGADVNTFISQFGAGCP